MSDAQPLCRLRAKPGRAQQCYEWVMGDTRTCPRSRYAAHRRGARWSRSHARPPPARGSSLALLARAGSARRGASASTATACRAPSARAPPSARTPTPAARHRPRPSRSRPRRSPSAPPRRAPQTERSATFAGEMTADPGHRAHADARRPAGARARGDCRYRTVSAPGLSVWRGSDPGVKVFTLHQAGHEPVGARRLPRGRALSLAERAAVA